ncbi:hypothetical protein NECID01_1989 [Nematocida sp. AWRm77]|nr:hypothetical protein NECID01_1989 [Nematocida sp. AWRm77]
MLFLANFLRGKCAQCIEHNPTSITELCICGAELCQKHAPFHCLKNHVKVPISIEKTPDKVFLNIDVCNAFQISNTLEILKNKLLICSVVAQDGAQDTCMHLLNVFHRVHMHPHQKVFSRISVYYSSSTCSLCCLHANLWMCVWCGLIFCGKMHYYCNGNSHAAEHFETTGHTLFVGLDTSTSAQPPALVYCCLCERFVQSTLFCDLLFSFCHFLEGCFLCNSEKLSLPQTQDCKHCENFKNKQIVRKECWEEKGGIDNSEHVSHIASTLYAVSFCIWSTTPSRILPNRAAGDAGREEASFGDVFRAGMGKLLVQYAQGSWGRVCIDTLLQALQEMSPYDEEKQPQDVARFYRNLIALIKKRDEKEDFSFLSDMFHLCLHSYIKCISCKDQKEKVERTSVIYLKPKQSIEEFFSIKQLDAECRCSATSRTVKTFFTEKPEVITVRMKKAENHVLGKEEFTQLEEEISVPYVRYKGAAFFHALDYGTEERLCEISSLLSTLEIDSSAVHERLLQHLTKSEQTLADRKEDKQAVLSHHVFLYLPYRIRAAIIYQIHHKEGVFFVQLWTEKDSLPDKDSKWTTILNGTITQEPLFFSDAILLFYFSADTSHISQE